MKEILTYENFWRIRLFPIFLKKYENSAFSYSEVMEPCSELYENTLKKKFLFFESILGIRDFFSIILIGFFQKFQVFKNVNIRY
jgi:hypothetical protein